MSDPRYIVGAPQEDLSLYPATYAIPERIPKNEVDAYIAAHPELELHLLPFEEVRAKVSTDYFLENEYRLKYATPEEHDQYRIAYAALEKQVADENDSEDESRVSFRKRKDELTDAMQGPLTPASANTVGQNAKALVEVKHLMSFDEVEKKQRELEEFLTSFAKEFNEERK